MWWGKLCDGVLAPNHCFYLQKQLPMWYHVWHLQYVACYLNFKAVRQGENESRWICSNGKHIYLCLKSEITTGSLACNSIIAAKFSFFLSLQMAVIAIALNCALDSTDYKVLQYLNNSQYDNNSSYIIFGSISHVHSDFLSSSTKERFCWAYCAWSLVTQHAELQTFSHTKDLLMSTIQFPWSIFLYQAHRPEFCCLLLEHFVEQE